MLHYASMEDAFNNNVPVIHVGVARNVTIFVRDFLLTFDAFSIFEHIPQSFFTCLTIPNVILLLFFTI